MRVRITLLDNNDTVYWIVVHKFLFSNFALSARNVAYNEVNGVLAANVITLYSTYYSAKNAERKHQRMPLYDMETQDLYDLINLLFGIIKYYRYEIEANFGNSGNKNMKFGNDDELNKFLRRVVLEDYFFINVQIE